MMLIEETSVPETALPVEAFKAHLRLGSGFGVDTLQDEVLLGFLRAAMVAIEARAGKALIRRVFAWSLNSWQTPNGQALPVAPVHSVASVVLVARDGAETEVDPQGFWLERDAQRSVLRPTFAVLPSIPKAGSVRLEIDAGFGVT